MTTEKKETRRIQLVVSCELVARLDALGAAIGVSRSACAAMLLSEALLQRQLQLDAVQGIGASLAEAMQSALDNTKPA